MIQNSEELQSEFDELTLEQQQQIEIDTAQSDFQGASPEIQYSMYQIALPYEDDMYWKTIVECYEASIVEPTVG